MLECLTGVTLPTQAKLGTSSGRRREAAREEQREERREQIREAGREERREERREEAREERGAGPEERREERKYCCDIYLNPQEVRELQHLLNRAGYSIHADGVFGKESRDALSAWQRRVGMRDDGSPTYEVFERLRRDFDGHFAPPEAEAPPEWVKVERGQNREPGYVQLSKTKPVKFEVKSLAINYNAGQPSGIETVSSESIQMVKKILSHPDTVAIGALEITGKTYYGRGGEKNGLRLLSRQAALMDAISQLGYDVSRNQGVGFARRKA